jgi:hypothetical protein
MQNFGRKMSQKETETKRHRQINITINLGGISCEVAN